MLTKYAYLVFHAHSAIWKERNCKTSDGSSIKYCQEIMHILDAIKLSKEVAVIHCRGHQRGDSDITEGSRRDDQQAKGEATQSFNTQASFLWDKFPTDIKPHILPRNISTLSLVEIVYSSLDGFKQKMKNLYCP